MAALVGHALHQGEAVAHVDVPVVDSDADEIDRLAGDDFLKTGVPEGILVVRDPPRTGELGPIEDDEADPGLRAVPDGGRDPAGSKHSRLVEVDVSPGGCGWLVVSRGFR